MITEAHGNLLVAPVEALVNTVNTEGVMGKGIALQFKRAYPAMFKAYAAAAKRGDVKLGQMHVWPTQSLDGPRYIINFPTKGHWRAGSKLQDIESGLRDLIRVIDTLDLESIAIPPLGCGNGGLHWRDVEPKIREALRSVPNVDVHLFAPAGAPAAADMPNRSQKPKMTPGRAALVGLIDRYSRATFSEPSLLETQKLMYFLQLMGEPLNLEFKQHHYGPYADNLRHVLNAIEGHYLTGFGDGTAKVLDLCPLTPTDDAAPVVEAELSTHPETEARMQRVLELTVGYESAYGLELLSTVHWVATHAPGEMTDDDVAQKVAAWSPRKARSFTPDHVSIALSDLRSRGILTSA